MESAVRLVKRLGRVYWNAGGWDREYGFWVALAIVLALIAFVLGWSAFKA